jgi:hypothetical protein
LESLRHPPAFTEYLQPLCQAEWVVYAKPPLGGAAQVLAYLGRYTHRTAISNERLRSMENGEVTFGWKDYRHQNRPKVMSLAAAEFLRRFLLHILPPGFRRIRYFGWLANCHRKPKLLLCRQLLTHPITELLPGPGECRERLRAFSAETSLRCSNCGIGEMIRVETLPAYRWPARPPDTS